MLKFRQQHEVGAMAGGEKLCKWVVEETILELVGGYRKRKVDGWWLLVLEGG